MTRGRKLRVAVLMGGVSTERDVSFSSGRQVLEGLDPDKYDAFGVDAALMPGSRIDVCYGANDEIGAIVEAREALRTSGRVGGMELILSDDPRVQPDLVFVVLHGKYGEDGTIQGLLDLLNVPYTGSGVLASSLAMDKGMTKRIFTSAGIRTPECVEFSTKRGVPGEQELLQAVGTLAYPLIVKPSRQGSTIGMTKITEASQLHPAVTEAALYDSQIVVERFIEGTELTVAVLGNEEAYALPVIEIVPNKGFYDYEAKYTPGATEEIVPARIGEEDTKRVQSIAVAAHKALGCSGASRVDFILSAGEMYALEVNTIPGMTPTSLLPRAAEAAGISFSSLLDRIVEYALEDKAQQ